MNRKSNLIERIKILVNQRSYLKSFRQITIFSGGSFIAQIVMMIYAVIVARALGPSQLGIYNGLYAILGVTITFVNFGLDLWMLNEAHHYDSVRLISGEVFSIKLVLGAIWAISSIFLLSVIRREIFSPLMVSLAVIDALCDILFNTISTSWSIVRKIRRINIMLFISRIGKFFLLIGLILFDSISPISIIGSRFIISLIVLIISLIQTKPIINFGKLSFVKNILKRAVPFGFSDILAMIYGNIDVAILSFYSITNTGLYSPASGIIHALFIIPNSIYIYLLPKYSKQIIDGNKNSTQNILHQVLAIFTIVGLTISLILFFGGEIVVTLLLGSEYTSTGNLLKILSPIMLLKSISFGLALIIIITGNQKKRLLPQLLVSIINIIFNILLIPYFGLVSVAWIYTISELFLMIGYYILVIRNT